MSKRPTAAIFRLCNWLLPHFGLGSTGIIDSVVVKWPGGKMQVITHVATNQVLKVNKKDAQLIYSWQKPAIVFALLYLKI